MSGTISAFEWETFHVSTNRQSLSRLSEPLHRRNRAPESRGAAGGGEGKHPQADRELQPGTGGTRRALRTTDDAGPTPRAGRTRAARENGREPARRQSRAGQPAGAASADRAARAGREPDAARIGR